MAWLKANGFKYLKVDSGGCYNDMQLWHDLLEQADYLEEVTVENCHQVGHGRIVASEIEAPILLVNLVRSG